MNKQKQLFTIPQASELLTLSESCLRTWVWKKRIKFIRLGRAIRIPAAEIQRLLARGTQQ